MSISGLIDSYAQPNGTLSSPRIAAKLHLLTGFEEPLYPNLEAAVSRLEPIVEQDPRLKAVYLLQGISGIYNNSFPAAASFFGHLGHHGVEDLVEVVTLNTLEAIPRFKHTVPDYRKGFRGFVSRTTKNVGISMLRHRKARPEEALPEGPGEAAVQVDYDGIVEEDFQRTRLQFYVSILADTQRQIIELFLQEKNLGEIAEAVGKSYEIVKAQYHNAVRRLQDIDTLLQGHDISEMTPEHAKILIRGKARSHSRRRISEKTEKVQLYAT